MKKNLLFLAAAAITLASCSSDETTEVNQGEAISFRPLMTNVTRAIDVNLGSTGFKVTATKAGDTSTPYFQNVEFTGTTTFTSATKYYWPSAYNLDFYAWAPGSITSDYSSIAVNVDADAANQIDLVYASTKKWGKFDETGRNDGTSGVTLNFRHAMSKVIINLKNTNSNLTFTIGDVTIGNLYDAGTFAIGSTVTDGNNSALLSGSLWTPSGSQNNAYSQTVATASAYSTSTPAQAGVDMILLPQVLNVATAYTQEGVSPAADDPFNGAYIKVQLRIQNTLSSAYIVGSAGFVEAMWPLTALTWEPGKKYTYTVDLAGGGYYPVNHSGDDALDPILEDGAIKFATVTVDDWTDAVGGVYTSGL